MRLVEFHFTFIQCTTLWGVLSLCIITLFVIFPAFLIIILLNLCNLLESNLQATLYVVTIVLICGSTPSFPKCGKVGVMGSQICSKVLQFERLYICEAKCSAKQLDFLCLPANSKWKFNVLSDLLVTLTL